MDEVVVCRLMALARKKWPKDYAAKAKLALVKDPAPVKEPPIQRPAIFALGPMEARRRAARG